MTADAGRPADSHILDQPIWNALTSYHAALAQGDMLAKRYPGAVLPFAAMPTQNAEHWLALLGLVKPDRPCVLIQAEPIIIPDGREAKVTTGFQMLAERADVGIPSPEVTELDADRDANELLELAVLAKPGPVQRETFTLGRFWGIRSKGRLVAMAGERFRLPGFTEISAVCTHPDHRGRGLAKLVTGHAAARIRADASTPILHVYASNVAAVRLYEQLGFTTRLRVHTAIIG